MRNSILSWQVFSRCTQKSQLTLAVGRLKCQAKTRKGKALGLRITLIYRDYYWKFEFLQTPSTTNDLGLKSKRNVDNIFLNLVFKYLQFLRWAGVSFSDKMICIVNQTAIQELRNIKQMNLLYRNRSRTGNWLMLRFHVGMWTFIRFGVRDCFRLVKYK